MRFWSEILSLLGLLVVLVVLLRGTVIPWGQIGILLIVVIGSGVLLNLARSQNRARGYAISDLSMDFLRAPYLHRNPQGIRFGNDLRLSGYGYSAGEIWGGQELTVTLHWSQVLPEDVEAEVSLVTPAQQLFRADDAVAISRVPIAGSTTEHRLLVSPRAVPGLYLVRVRVFGPNEQLSPVNEAGEKLGSTYLQPVRVFNQRPAPSPQPVLASFGDSIRLGEMRLEPITAERINVELEWMATQPIPRNYALSFRFLGEDEEMLFSQDLQPHYGFFPTSLWLAGELVFDSYTFRVPGENSTADIAAVELVVYRVEDLVPLGSYTLILDR